MKSLQSAATELGFKILEAFEVNGKKGIDALTEAIRNFDATPIIDFFKMVRDGLAFIWEWRTAIAIVAGVFFSLKLALAAAEIAMLIFNIAAAANPIGLIVLAISGLILGFSALIIWIDDIIAAFDSMPLILQAILGPIKLLLLAIKGIKIIAGGLIGLLFDDDEEEAEGGDRSASGGNFKRLAPEEIEEIGRSEAARFSGRLDIAGAPEGSKVTTDPGSDRGFDVALLGVGA